MSNRFKGKSSPVQVDTVNPQSNASIWPVQLRDLQPGEWLDDKKLQVVQLDEIDFEEVSFFVDIKAITERVFDLEIKLEDSDAASTKAQGKRVASSGLAQPKSNKKIKLEGTDQDHHTTILVDTACIFKVEPRTDLDRNRVARILEHLQSSHTGDQLAVGRVTLLTTKLDQPDTIFGHHILLQDQDSTQVLAHAPLIDTRKFDPSLRPDKYTNGEWLSSAKALADNQTIALEASLSVVKPPAGLPPQENGLNLLFIKLAIQVRVPISTTTHGPALFSAIEHMAELVRFADVHTGPEQEEKRRSEINASFVYATLRAARLDAPDSIQPEGLNPVLLPFQKRSTAFLLGREGKSIDEHGTLTDLDGQMAHDGRVELGLWWKQIRQGLYYNAIECRFVEDARLSRSSNLKGAMLAEEMGLGKTVEVISLIMLNPAQYPAIGTSWYDEVNEIDVTTAKTTLIVAPETLRQQWLEELDLHAPELHTYSYTGRLKAEKDVSEGKTWVEWAKEFDVIIASYTVLSSELNTARKEPERSRRQARKYERPRSPLIKLHFHRVVMDEVQLVGNSNAAVTASMISRTSSLAVSGTPVKKIDDLMSCFRFLRVPGVGRSPAERQQLLSPNMVPSIVSLLQTLGTRHTKAQVAGEMLLPKQTRMLVPIDFTAIEAAFYADVWRDALDVVQFDAQGKPLGQAWQLDLGQMRNQLLQLRQACTHPQVAVHARGGMVGSHNLRSIDEVLELMIDGTKSDLFSTRQSLYDRRILKAILTLYYREEERHLIVEAQLWDIFNELKRNIAVAELDVKKAKREGPLYKFTDKEIELEEKENARLAARDVNGDHEEDPEQREKAAPDSSGEWQALCRDSRFLEKRKHRALNLTKFSNGLRVLLIRQHRVEQFIGNLYFQRGEFIDQKMAAENEEQQAVLVNGGGVRSENQLTVPVKADPDGEDKERLPHTVATIPASVEDTKTDAVAKSPHAALRAQLKAKEDEAYVAAEATRQRILAEHRVEVETAVRRLDGRTKIKFTQEAMICKRDLFEEGGGISTHDSYTALAHTCELLDRNTEVLFTWRDSIIQRLRRPVNRDINLDKDDDDQYQENLDTQVEAETLLEMYRPLIAEREKMLTGTVAVGATAKPQLYAELEVALRTARRRQLMARDDVEDETGDEALRVQKQQLEHFKQLDKERLSVTIADLSHSLQGMQGTLRDIVENTLVDEEVILARRAILEAKKIVNEQNKMLDKIKAEERTLAVLFNARSKYFKEMQLLSDSVGDPEFYDLDKSISEATKEEAKLRTKLETTERRLRYIIHLGKVQSIDSMDEDAKRCYICTDLITVGVLANACGHVSCERCFKEWQGQGHRSCPMCKTRVLPTEVHRIVYRKISQDKAAKVTGSSGSQVVYEYNMIDDAERIKIEDTLTQGRFGSKIDTVTKHIKRIYDTTEEKSLVFSSFARGLDVVAQSLTANGIRYLRLTTGGGKAGGKVAKQFRTSDIPVLLLHSEAQSAGLNLLSATHIHLLEPLLNRSLELQALSRVHRIGQTKETQVWCNYVVDTVEERILDMASNQGQSLYLLNKSGQESLNWGAAGGTKGDFTTNKEELLGCFFPRTKAPVDERQKRLQR